MPEPFPRFLEAELEPRAARECRFHVLPAPYEATVSYGGGTAGGPRAILEASNQLEVWTGDSRPSDSGIYTWPAIDCSGNAERVLERIASATLTALRAGPRNSAPDLSRLPSRQEAGFSFAAASAVPVLLGGEHTVTLGALRALKERYGHFGVIQFDAHADLRDTYQGSPYSHACVMRRAVDDLGLSLFQIGVRGLSPEEARAREERGIRFLDARDLRPPLPRNSAGPCVTPFLPIIPEDFPRNVYLTFDVDALDASLMPATGTPEPGGLFWWDALFLVESSLRGRVCLGFDVVELAPVPQLHAATYTAARLTHEIMGILGRQAAVEPSLPGSASV